MAVSILERVRESGALCAATTHYAELKEFALDTDGVCNAGCEFDLESLRPTYRLIIGAPGKSNAFAISRKLGLDEEIVRRAESYVSGESRRFESVIAGLEESRADMERERAEAQRLREELESYKKTEEERLPGSNTAESSGSSSVSVLLPWAWSRAPNRRATISWRSLRRSSGIRMRRISASG